MIGFTFKGVHSSEFSIGAKSVDRTLIPELRRSDFEIPGRDGTVDYDDNTYGTRSIEVEIGFVKNTSFAELRKSARDVAFWLSGKGDLIFDDEPDKMYKAAIYAPAGIEQMALMPAALTNITFDCQPFAEDIVNRQVTGQVRFGEAFVVESEGTQRTPCKIYLKNNGDTPLRINTLIRKAEK